MRVLASSEIRPILRIIPPQSPFGVRDRSMLVVLLHTGLRVSEICGLTVADVAQWSVPRKMLDLPVHLGKGGHARLIPPNTSAREAIATILRFNQARGFSTAPDAPLLVNRLGQALPVRTFQNLVQRYREAAQLLERITPQVYTHPTPADLEKAMDTIG